MPTKSQATPVHCDSHREPRWHTHNCASRAHIPDQEAEAAAEAPDAFRTHSGYHQYYLRTQATLYLLAHSITRTSDLLLSKTMPSSYPVACAKQILTAKRS